MVDDPTVRDAVRSFILDNLLPGEAPESLEDSAPLLSSGVVTSLSLLEVVTFLEEKFHFVFDVHDLGVSRMDTVDLIVDLVLERTGSGPRQVGA